MLELVSSITTGLATASEALPFLPSETKGASSTACSSPVGCSVTNTSAASLVASWANTCSTDAPPNIKADANKTDATPTFNLRIPKN